MSSVVLTEVVPGLGLYAIGPPDAAQLTVAYYLLIGTASPPASPTLEQTWSDITLIGWYVFLTEPLSSSNAAAFAKAARAGLPPLSGAQYLNPRGICWLTDTWQFAAPAAAVLIYQPSATSPQRAPIATTTLSWSGSAPGLGLDLSMTGNVAVDLDTNADGLQITTTASGTDQIQLLYMGQKVNAPTIQYAGWVIDIPFVGATAGALAFDLGLDFGRLYQYLGCGSTFAYPSAQGAASLTYPFAFQQPGTGIYLAMHMRLHPLYPTSPDQTILAFDLDEHGSYSQNSCAFKAQSFLTVNGSVVTLQPVSVTSSPPVYSPEPAGPLPPGFALGKGPVSGPLSSPDEFCYNIIPVGTYQVTATAPPPFAASGEHAATKPRRLKKSTAAAVPFQLLCGLSGQEYLAMEVGDVVEFVPGQPAYAPGFSLVAAAAGTAETLTDDFTTSWVRYPVSGTTATSGYFAQPSASVYYASDPNDVYPAAVTSLLSPLVEPVLFPMVPYGGVTPGAGSAPDATIYTAFEGAVLSTVRHSVLAVNSAGPVFTGGGSTSRMPTRRGAKKTKAALAAQVVSAAVTTEGLIAHLNPANGTWSDVQIALSPDISTQFLSFDTPPNEQTVSPVLANVLLQDQLFLVVSLAEPLGAFANEITMAGFNFKLDVSLETTILIFKYNTSRSLRNLVAQPSLWAKADVFVGGSPDSTAATQEAILDSFRVAADLANAPGNPFGTFNALIDQPEWTGILALGCAIDGKGMPPDLAMLLGGIPGQLRAHHFGIQANRIARVPDLHIDQTSLFGVIHYQNESPASTTADFQYSVETLVVAFANSRVTQFTVEVGLTINTLFGRSVSLVSDGNLSPPPPPNTVVIPGQYQTQAGVGTVVFTTDNSFVYSFPTGGADDGSPTLMEGPSSPSSRVLQQITIEQASLVPLTAPGGTSPEQVTASFRLGGELWFSAMPFPGADVDLFSYGVTGSPGTGAAFSNLTVNVSFLLDSMGSMVPGSETVEFQPQLFTINPSESCIRPGSLLDSLPMRVSKFTYAAGGMSASSLGALPIHVLELEGMGVTSPAVRSYPYVTSSPQYALEFDLPLGSLGGLSGAHAGLTASLIIGWGPSLLVPDCDAAAVFVQLPAAMAGYGGFNLQGILKTTFGDANLLKVELSNGPVYAILFNNVKLSVLGYSFPPGILIDFTIFAGQPEAGQSANASNIAWFLSAVQPVTSPPSAA